MVTLAELVRPELASPFQLAAVRFMCSSCLDLGEPDEAVQAWMDEAADQDRVYLAWAIGTWETIRNLNSFDLERLRQEARAAAAQTDL